MSAKESINEEICPKCQKEKLPFDVTCESCNTASLFVEEKNVSKITKALNQLGYSHHYKMQKNKFCSKGSLDRKVVYISVHRQEQDALLEILTEITEKDLVVEMLEKIT